MVAGSRQWCWVGWVGDGRRFNRGLARVRTKRKETDGVRESGHRCKVGARTLRAERARCLQEGEEVWCAWEKGWDGYSGRG